MATFSTAIAEYTFGFNSLTVGGLSQMGTFVIDSTANVASIAVNAGLMQIDANGNVTASTINVGNSSTFAVDGC